VDAAVWAGLVLVGVATGALLLWRARSNARDLGSASDRTTYATLHTASLAAPHLRHGLTRDGARKAARPIRALLGSPAIAIVAGAQVLAWDGAGGAHRAGAVTDAALTLETGRTVPLGPRRPGAPAHESLRYAVAAPLVQDELVVGALIAYAPIDRAGLLRAVDEVARFVSTQLDLGELDRSRARAMEAEVRALRAQISPHFVYNALSAIASFVRTDPERARELLLEFADYTRYSYRRHGDFTSLAEELRSVDRYLALERARFGDRLVVSVTIAPEVLSVAIPFLSVQPLVENAVQHGLARKTGPGRLTVVAVDAGPDCLVTVEDDGVGMDPDDALRTLTREDSGEGIGLANVDERMRSVYGDAYGLVVETGPDLGTKVSLRIPKYHSGVHAT
jgi:two-component system LytT family sensor kinase